VTDATTGSELLDVGKRGTLEPHDGLVVVAHGHDVGPNDPLAKEVHHAHLAAVRVLELVHLYVAMAVLQGASQAGIRRDGLYAVHDHVVVVDEPPFLQRPLIVLVRVAGHERPLARGAHRGAADSVVALELRVPYVPVPLGVLPLARAAGR
jgi:hypothetical protein